jgi:hypothetical protein
MRELFSKYHVLQQHQDYVNDFLRSMSMDQFDTFIDDVLEDVYLYYCDTDYYDELDFVQEWMMIKLLHGFEHFKKHDQTRFSLYSIKYNKFAMYRIMAGNLS